MVQAVGQNTSSAVDAAQFAVNRSLGRKIDAQDPRAAREAAAMMTSQLFFAPLLAEMRKLPFGKEYGHGGRMEDALGEQLDMHMADTVSRSDQGLTSQLAAKLLRTPTPEASWRTAEQAGVATGSAS